MGCFKRFQENLLRPEESMLWTLSWSPHPELPFSTLDMVNFQLRVFSFSLIGLLEKVLSLSSSFLSLNAPAIQIITFISFVNFARSKWFLIGKKKKEKRGKWILNFLSFFLSHSDFLIILLNIRVSYFPCIFHVGWLRPGTYKVR